MGDLRGGDKLRDWGKKRQKKRGVKISLKVVGEMEGSQIFAKES